MNEGIFGPILDDISNSNNIQHEEFETCTEAIGTDLDELDSIDQSIEDYEKASFESVIENINLLNNVLAYKNVKSGIALESVSSEFGISTEGIKEIAEKGLDSLKAIGKKLVEILKSIIAFFKVESKTVKNIKKKIKLTENDLRYIHKTNNKKDIFTKLYDPDRFTYIFTKELILCKFLFRDFNYDTWLSRLKGTYIVQDYEKILENTLKEVFYDAEEVDGVNPNSGVYEYFMTLGEGVNLDPKLKIGNLKDFFEKYNKVTYKKSNNAFDYDDFDFLNNIYVLSDFLERNCKEITNKLNKLISQANLDDNKKRYSPEHLNELISLLGKYKTEHSKNIKEYVSYCGNYLKEVKKYEHLDKVSGNDSMKKAKDDSGMSKFHYDAFKPDSFEFKSFDTK